MVVNMEIVLNEKEIVVRKSRATHWKYWEGVGGKLLLTNKRLIFKSHGLNVHSHEEAIPLEAIISIEAKYSDFISAKMMISLSSGAKEKYYVPHRKAWVKDIKSAMEQLRSHKWSHNQNGDPRKP